MHTKHKTIILLFSIIVSMAGAAPIARIMKSEGNVLIKRMGKSTFTIPSKPGLGINNGDAIKVGEEGFAVAIFIDDKSVIKIREKTQFEFIESASSRTLDIEQGTMFFDIKKEGRTKTFRVETPVSVASVKGTEFAVISSPAGIDQVFCASGQLDVQNLISGQSVVVGPGQKAISNAMGNVMELPFTPDDYPADPEGVQPELKTEQKPESEPEQPQQQQRQESSVQETQEEQDEEPETEEDQEQEQMESDDTPSQSQPSKPEPKKPFGMGLGVGSVTIDGILYNQIALRPEINIGKIGIGLDLVFYIDNKGNIKEDEWDFKNDPSRIFDKILFLRWGEESDPFWVKFGSLDNVTLGYGGILSGYSNMMEFPEVRRIGLNTGVNIAGIGGQLFMSNMKDFSRGGTILGLRGTYKVSDSFPLTVGLNFVTDMNQFSGLKDIDEDSYPDIFDDFPNDANYYNDTDGDGVPDPHPGVKVPEEGWDIDADGDNIYDENEDAADLVLKGVPFSIADNKSSVTGFAFDVGYPLLKGKVFSLDLYTEFNFLNFPEVGAPDSLFYRPNYSGKSFSVPGLRASLFNFLKLSYEFRIKDGYFVPQFFDQSYDLTRVVPEYIDGSAIVKTKDMTLFADSSMNVGLGGHFGSISADVFGFGSLYGSYTNMTSETDTVNSFVAALTLNAERIPKLSEATAFYQRTNDSNPFDFENPSVNTVMGYRLGYELGKGISVIWDYRQFYRFTGALNDDGTGKLEPVVQTTIETSFNF